MPAGASIGLRIRSFRHGADYDPVNLNARLVVQAWVESVQQGYPLHILNDPLEEAIARARRTGPSWTHCVDPVDSTFLTLGRLRWGITSMRHCVDDLGQPCDAIRFGAPEVARRANQSANRWADRQSLYKPPAARSAGY